jgi:hypothetical protein
MTIRSFTALVLFIVGLIDFQRFVSLRIRQHRKSVRKLEHEVLMTWEGEGGNLPPQEARPGSSAPARR